MLVEWFMFVHFSLSIEEKNFCGDFVSRSHDIDIHQGPSQPISQSYRKEQEEKEIERDVSYHHDIFGAGK